MGKGVKRLVANAEIQKINFGPEPRLSLNCNIKKKEKKFSSQVLVCSYFLWKILLGLSAILGKLIMDRMISTTES